MRCRKAHKLIADKLEGTLDERGRAELEKHLEACPDCRDLLRDFEGIVEAARDLPKPEPSDGVWPKIKASYELRRREGLAAVPGRERVPGGAALFPRRRLAFAAALVLVAFAAGMLALFGPFRTGGPAAGSAGFTMAKLAEAEKHYTLAIKALTEAAAADKNGMDAATAAVFKRNLDVIDGVIQACRKAVAENPDSVDARVYLLGAYKQKVETLDDLVALKSDLKKAASGRTGAGPVL